MVRLACLTVAWLNVPGWGMSCVVVGFCDAFGWFNSVGIVYSFFWLSVYYLTGVFVIVGLCLVLFVVGYDLSFLVRLFVGWFVLWMFWVLD